MRKTKITETELYLPKNCVKTKELEEKTGASEEVLLKKSEIRQKHYTSDGETASIMGAFPYRWHTLGFLQSYWITMRPYLMYVSGITGFLGLSLTNLPLPLILLYGFVFFLSYGFGQALTDCFQLDTDELSSPYRPLVKGLIQKRDVLTISLASLSISGLILSNANIWNIPLAAVAIVGLVTYTYFKRRWWGGPFYNAWIVAVLGLMGYLCGGVSLFEAWKNPYLPGFLFTIFFGYSNFVLIGYFKDIKADKETGYMTLPVVLGRNVSSWVSALFATLTLLAPVILTLRNPQWQSASFLIPGIVFLFLAQYQIFKVETDHDAHQPIANVVHGYLLVLGSLICFQKPSWYLFLLSFYFLFVVTLKKRPMRQQI